MKLYHKYSTSSRSSISITPSSLASISIVEKPYHNLGLLDSGSDKFTVAGKIDRVGILQLSCFCSLSSSGWFFLSDFASLPTSSWFKRFFLALPFVAALSTNKNLCKATIVFHKATSV